jgi:hypothetical protein
MFARCDMTTLAVPAQFLYIHRSVRPTWPASISALLLTLWREPLPDYLTAGREDAVLLWNQNKHYCVHTDPPLPPTYNIL